MPRDSLPKDVMSDFQLQILSTDQLLKQPAVLHAVVSLVNAAYLDHKIFNGTLRFDSDDRLCSELGQGLCAVLLDRESYAVATASVKMWTKEEKENIERLHGSVFEVQSGRRFTYEKDASNQYHFELAAVASRNDHQYRKKGLIEQCVKALESHLMKQLSTDEMDIQLTFWVRVVADINGEYWRRKGFCEFGQGRMMPKGTWRADEPFLFIAMNKSVTKIG